jgi:hypothetical protein
MTPQYIAAAVVIGLFGAACTTTYTIQPAMGGAVGTVASGALTMSVAPNAWNGQPSDLADHLTPLWIRITNQGREAVRISYADFALVDNAGFRYAAINPYTGQTNVSPAPSGPQPATSGAVQRPPAAIPPPHRTPNAPPPATPAEPPAGEPGDNTSEPGYHWEDSNGPETELERNGRRVPLADVELVRYGGHGGGHAGGHFGGRGYVGPRGGFYVHPYYHGYFHHYAPWPYFYYGPPYYGSYVYYWDDRYYPAAPSHDVMRFGLPEGVLNAGGRVSGFVYFQNAGARATNLQFTWTAHPLDGRTLASLSVPLVVVED